MPELFNYLKECIKPELLVIIPVLYFIGAGLKNSKTFADNKIPAILGGTGILLATLYVLATVPLGCPQDFFMAAFTAVVQGILCAGCSVYINQIIIQKNK